MVTHSLFKLYLDTRTSSYPQEVYVRAVSIPHALQVYEAHCTSNPKHFERVRTITNFGQLIEEGA